MGKWILAVLSILVGLWLLIIIGVIPNWEFSMSIVDPDEPPVITLPDSVEPPPAPLVHVEATENGRVLALNRYVKGIDWLCVSAWSGASPEPMKTSLSHSFRGLLADGPSLAPGASMVLGPPGMALSDPEVTGVVWEDGSWQGEQRCSQRATLNAMRVISCLSRHSGDLALETRLLHDPQCHDVGLAVKAKREGLDAK